MAKLWGVTLRHTLFCDAIFVMTKWKFFILLVKFLFYMSNTYQMYQKRKSVIAGILAAFIEIRDKGKNADILTKRGIECSSS